MNIVHINNNQESLSQLLMDQIRELCLDPTYDNMTLSTVIGVLEMVKFEMMKREES